MSADRAMTALADRISRTPALLNAAAGADAADGLSGPMAELVAGAAGASPYLAKLAHRHRDWLAEAATRAPETVMAELVAAARASGSGDQRAVMSELRTAKARAALLIALADLGGAWTLEAVTGALSDLADAAIGAAADHALGLELARGRLPGLTPDDLATGAGFVVIAMGKLGAGELNYSSDIDLICLFDESRFAPDDYGAAKAAYVRATRLMVKVLSEATHEGYVFRTDLRLRPSPSTTPVCLAIEAAERYYESVGRTWERAAHIKARAAAGDIAAGERYLASLAPFVWRRYLDFAAIEEAHDMRRKIRAEKGRHGRIDVVGHDIKLGAGGIREIEFFAQTHQLIMGGRMPHLRVRGTLAALARERDAGLIEEGMRAALAADYAAHRDLEHRLQMVEDAQTQTMPTSEEGRARVAALAGTRDLAAFERDIAARLSRVHATCEGFFKPTGRRTEQVYAAGLAELGFARADDACRMVERWLAGKIPATRSERSRRKFEALAPGILTALGGAASPDDAIALFDRFLSGLPGGVQLFSLFEANPHLLDLIVEICAAAPRLADYLGRNAHVLDTLLDRDFFEPIPEAPALAAGLEARLAGAEDYERALDAVRRWAKELRFRTGVQVLRGIADAKRGRAGVLRHRGCGDRGRAAARHRRVRRAVRPPAGARPRDPCHGQARQPRDDRGLGSGPDRDLRSRWRRGERGPEAPRRAGLLCAAHAGADFGAERAHGGGCALRDRHAPAPLGPAGPGGDDAGEFHPLPPRGRLDLGAHGAHARTGRLGRG